MRRLRGEVVGFCLGLVVAFYVLQTEGASFHCGEDKFYCGNQTCISEFWRCDGDNDCKDNSDEENCPIKVCNNNTEFRCTNGKCIPKRWVCDLDDDCHDGSDEPYNCSDRTCSATEFTCRNRNCVSQKWLCDQDNDCGDRSDEHDCGNKTCPPTEFACSNGKCITRSWQCDQDDDCGDNSDEIHCPPKTCRPTEFTCANKKCIKRDWRCDGDNDCEDDSDELGCPTGGVGHCTLTQFQCDTAVCIHMGWVCDGDPDCEDHSDEKGCNLTSCHPSEYTCDNGRCISQNEKCNGKNDCYDGSDETDCVTPTPKVCTDDKFQCGDSQQCIQKSSVCDAKRDCANGADEPRNCDINECLRYNGHCQQYCNNTKTDYFCSCRPGYRVDPDDGRSCQDIDECRIPGQCSQVCYNTKGYFKCSCMRGYNLEPDRRTCKAIGEPGFLLFANRHNIRRILLDSSEYTEVFSERKASIVAIDFHVSSGYIFWTDVTEEKIYRAQLNNTLTAKPEAIVSSGLRIPDGVAVDWINEKLYWTDAGTNCIEVSEFDGKNRLQLISTHLDEPRAIVVAPAMGLMFYSDWGEEPKIEKCGMNGDPATRIKIVTTHIMWPNALTIDYTLDRLWWADAKLHTIESSKLDGTQRRIIVSENIHHPFAITVFQDYMYWTDWEKGAIYKANKFTGKERVTLRESVYSPMDIHVYHKMRQPAGNNPCGLENGGCSHICLLAPANHHHDQLSCHCPSGLSLLYDKKTCNTSDAFSCKKKNSDIQVCKNGGTCVEQRNRLPECVCPVQYKGKKCQYEVSSPPPAKEGDGKKSVQPKEVENIGVTVGISVGVVVTILVLALLVGWCIYRRIQFSARSIMNFENPVYKKTTESNSSLEKIAFHFGSSSGRCQSLLGSFRNEDEISNC